MGTGQQLPNRTTALEFFNRHCEDATTTTTWATTTTTPTEGITVAPTAAIVNQPDQTPMIAGIAAAVVVVVIIVVVVAVVMKMRADGKADIEPRGRKDTAVPTEEEFCQTADQAKSLAVTPEGEEAAAIACLDAADNVPT